MISHQDITIIDRAEGEFQIGGKNYFLPMNFKSEIRAKMGKIEYTIHEGDRVVKHGWRNPLNDDIDDFHIKQYILTHEDSWIEVEQY